VAVHKVHHWYATHQLRSDTDSRRIHALLWHNSLKMIMTYAQVSSKKIEYMNSPFDDLEI
jgi:site-specific recombinase XerD